MNCIHTKLENKITSNMKASVTLVNTKVVLFIALRSAEENHTMSHSLKVSSINQ